MESTRIWIRENCRVACSLVSSQLLRYLAAAYGVEAKENMTCLRMPFPDIAERRVIHGVALAQEYELNVFR